MAAGAADDLLDLAKIRGGIALLNSADAVHWDAPAKRFSIDTSTLELLPAGYQQLFAMSAARASLEPLSWDVADDDNDDIVFAAAAPDENKLVETLNALGAGEQLIADFKTLFAGVSAHAHWWGIRLDLTKSAADALVQILKVDLKFLSALIPVFPHAALILTLVMAGGSVLGGWVKAANQGKNGVTVYLYLWVVPAVQSK